MMCEYIYYACQAYMLVNVSTLLIICEYLLCQTHMLATNPIKIMYEAIYIMPSTYVCNQTHQH